MLAKFVAGGRRQMLSTQKASFSNWAGLTAAPADPILGLNEAFKADTNPKKVLLGMGAYRDDQGKPYILECVRRAEQQLLDSGADHEYAPISGIDSYVQKCLKLAYGADSRALQEGRIAGAQSISGTGSLRLGFTFFKEWYPHKDIDVLIPNPTWPIHRNIANLVGYDFKEYRYYSKETKGLDFEGMKADIAAAKPHSLVMFHVCAHNPTGVDPTEAQWQEVLEVVKQKKLYAAFDSAY